MNKIANRDLFYLGLTLGFLRIFIGLIVSKLNIDIGYSLDIFILIYLYLWLIFIKKQLTFKNIVLANILIALLAILIYDLHILLFKHQGSLKIFFIHRVTVALNILIISLLSSTCYFFTQRFLSNR